MTHEAGAGLPGPTVALRSLEMAAVPTDVVTLYVCRLDPLELMFNTKPITAILGYPAESAIAMDLETVHRLMHPDDLPRLSAHVARLHSLLDGEIAEFRHRMRAASGEWAWLEVRDAVFSRDTSGAVQQVIGTAREVTAEMRAAEALRASEARHRLLSETMLQGVVHHGSDGSIIALNPAAERILGRPRDAFIGSHPEREARNTIRQDGSPFPGAEHPSTVAFRTGQPCHGVVMGVFNHDRQAYRWISVDAVPLMRRGETTPYEVYTVFEDITDRLSAEQALQEANTRKDLFIATLAHELRNPLAPIRNAVAVQQRRARNDPELAWSQSIIERQVGHMSRLLDDLLDASRIASGKHELRREAVLLSTVLTQSVETARPLIEQSGHTLEIVLPEQAIVIDGDPIRLAQVFSNLLTNAAKYTDDRGSIRVSARLEEAEMVAVRVRDTGIGIATEHQSRVFEMFGQVHDALERSQGGLGIGLSLARALVEMHGGTINVHSDGRGRGTEFTVRLPVIPSEVEMPETPAETPESAPVAAVRRRVLVVDDNRDGCDSLAAVLEMFGCDTATAYDGVEAIAVTETFHPEMILLDVGLPRLNGYDTCRSLRAAPVGEALVILAVTGWGTDADLRLAMAAGFDAHLVKPIDMEYLRQLLPLARDEVRRQHEVRLLRSGRGLGASGSRGQST